MKPQQQRRRDFETEARRQSRLVAEQERAPNSDGAEIMRWISGVADSAGWIE